MNSKSAHGSLTKTSDVRSCFITIIHMGLLAGLLTSIADMLYPLLSDAYYTLDYVAALLMFNIFFWMLTSLLLAFLISLILKIKPSLKKHPHRVIVVGFLVPFAGLYGLLSKLNMENKVLTDAPDNHLSLLWALLLLCIPLAFNKRKTSAANSAVSYIPELLRAGTDVRTGRRLK
jgi:hypothetical protein